MKQGQEPGKRIVSKSEYVLRRVFQGGLALSCTCAVGVAFLSGLAVVVALYIEVCTIIYALHHHHLQKELPDVLRCFLCIMAFGSVCWVSWRFALAAVKKSKENLVVPLTRANTAGLPAPDSLVRASAQPAHMQEAVLLRAAIQPQLPHEEQLLRASVEQRE